MNYRKFLEKAKKREGKILPLYKAGKTTSEIGRLFKISRQRVQQILKKHGVGRHDGGISIRTNKRKAKKQIARNHTYMNRYGCSYSQWLLIQKPYKKYRESPAYFYRNKKNDARLRNIEFRLTLPEWLQIWEESGQFNNCGRSPNQFCMARFNDQGAYELGNVRIITANENHREYYDNPDNRKRHGELVAKGRLNGAGSRKVRTS